MDKVYMLIIFYYVIVKGMVLNHGLSYFDHLFQKSLRYYHHKKNYKISLKEGIIPTGLRIKKEPAILVIIFWHFLII